MEENGKLLENEPKNRSRNVLKAQIAVSEVTFVEEKDCMMSPKNVCVGGSLLKGAICSLSARITCEVLLEGTILKLWENSAVH